MGDGFMAVCGHDLANLADQATRLLNFARALLQETAEQDSRFRKEDSNSPLLSSASRPPLRIRIGMHCGPAVAASLGMRNVKLSFFGDTVNIASRCAASSATEACAGAHPDVGRLRARRSAAVPNFLLIS